MRQLSATAANAFWGELEKISAKVRFMHGTNQMYKRLSPRSATGKDAVFLNDPNPSAVYLATKNRNLKGGVEGFARSATERYGGSPVVAYGKADTRKGWYPSRLTAWANKKKYELEDMQDIAEELEACVRMLPEPMQAPLVRTALRGGGRWGSRALLNVAERWFAAGVGHEDRESVLVSAARALRVRGPADAQNMLSRTRDLGPEQAASAIHRALRQHAVDTRRQVLDGGATLAAVGDGVVGERPVACDRAVERRRVREAVLWQAFFAIRDSFDFFPSRALCDRGAKCLDRDRAAAGAQPLGDASQRWRAAAAANAALNVRRGNEGARHSPRRPRQYRALEGALSWPRACCARSSRRPPSSLRSVRPRPRLPSRPRWAGRRRSAPRCPPPPPPPLPPPSRSASPRPARSSRPQRRTGSWTRERGRPRRRR